MLKKPATNATTSMLLLAVEISAHSGATEDIHAGDTNFMGMTDDCFMQHHDPGL